jgi:hypothetical protein
MDCEEFIRKLGENPSAREPEFIEHAQTCEKCQKLYLKQMSLERDLRRAINQKDNENLKSKIIAAYVQEQAGKKKKIFRLGWISAAAAILFTAFLGTKIYQNYSLNNFVLAHIDHEIAQLQNTERVSQFYLKRFYQAFDSEFLQMLPDVVYVEKCWMRTGFGLHLIVSGKQGPLTVLLMPNEAVEMIQTVESEIFFGKIYPLTQGSIALVGNPGESIDMLAEKLRMAMNAG